MNVDFAFICDHAEASGKINAMGIGFDTILAREVPVTHPYFFIVAQLRASVMDTGEKDVSIHLIDADGQNVVTPMNVKIQIAAPPKGGTESVARLAIGLNNVPFKKFGQYAIHVMMQGREIFQIPLRVAKAPMAQGQNSPHS